MERFQITLAGLKVELHSRFPLARSFCKDYLTESAAVDFSAEAADSEISALLRSRDAQDAPHAELLGLHRSIAEQLPRFGRFLVHGAAICWRGRGFLFLAPAGTGKSTHIRLWHSVLGDGVGIVNGDKPIIDASGEAPLVCGTPWAGKENWQNNIAVPLGAVCILRRGETDAIRTVTAGEEIAALLRQVYRPGDAEALQQTLALADRVFRTVPLYELRCTPTPNAVRAAFPALTGEEFREEIRNEDQRRYDFAPCDGE